MQLNHVKPNESGDELNLLRFRLSPDAGASVPPAAGDTVCWQQDHK
jgi:hypothetical protein